MNGRVLTRSQAADEAAKARAEGKTVVFTNGCFDILHLGHVRYLEKAKAFGDVLIVGVNSDGSVRRLKGEKRPIVSENERAEVISALRCVDWVTIFDEDTPCELIKALKPNVQAKGGDYIPENMPEYPVMKALGGRIEAVPYDETDTRGSSTTNIIEKILKSEK